MGWGIKLKAPKVSLPKSVSKALSSATKSIGDVASKTIKTAGKGTEGLVSHAAGIGESLAKGDIKGVGKEALAGLQSGKDVLKGLSSANLGLTTGLAGAAGQALGSNEISKAAENINREGGKGINTYGDAAIDTAANVGTGGTYGLAKAATQGLADKGLGSLVDSKALTQMATSAAAAEAGISPQQLQMAQNIASGDKGKMLQSIAGAAGVDPNIANQTQSLLKGDLKNSITNLAGKQLGVGDTQMSIAKDLVSGKSPQEIAMEKGRAIASDTAGAYANDIANQALDKSGIKNIQKAAESTYKIAKGDSLNAIAKKMGVDPKALAAANNIKDPNKISAGMNLKIPKNLNQPETPEQTEARRLKADQKALGNVTPEKGFLDKAKDFFGEAKDKITGAANSAVDLAKQNPSAVGAAANVLGGLAGYKMGEQATEEAFKDIGRARKGYEGVQQQVQKISPNQQMMADRSAATDVVKQRLGMGLTPEDKALLRQSQSQQAQGEQAGRTAATESATRRGAQGGQDIMAALQGATQAALTGGQQRDYVTTQSFQGRQQAAKDLSTIAQNAISSDFAQDLAKAKEAANIQQNIGQTYGSEASMQQAKAAQLAGLGKATGEAISNPLAAYSQNQFDIQKEQIKNTQPPATQPPDTQSTTQPPATQTYNQIQKDRVTNAPTVQPQSQPPINKFNQAQQRQPIQQGQQPQQPNMSQPKPAAGIQGLLNQGKQQVSNMSQMGQQQADKLKQQAQQKVDQAKQQVQQQAQQKVDQAKQNVVSSAKNAVQKALPFKL
jgi:LysM repeat protein/ElaB/YqjD/DUF883 family membrane-anchored ribosome-binding protein